MSGRIYWRNLIDWWRKGDNGSNDSPSDADVNEQHPLPIQLLWREDTQAYGPVDDAHRLPVVLPPSPSGRIVTATKVLLAAGNYAALDILAEAATGSLAWRFPNCAAVPGQQVVIVGVRMYCSEDSVTTRPRLWLFRRNPTGGSELDDNDVFNLDDADNRGQCVGWIDLPAFTDQGTVSITFDDDIRKYITLDGSSKDLYGIVQILDAEAAETAGMLLGVELEVI